MSETSPVRVVIVGGGISGLTAAYEIDKRAKAASREIELTVLDAAPRSGGVLATVQRNGCLMELGPDSMITDKPWARELCDEIGLSDKVIGTQRERRGSFLLREGRLVRTPEGFHLMAPSQLTPFILSPFVSPLGKLRMAMDLVLPRGPKDDESLAQFVRRRLGTEALTRVAQPMVGGIYTADPEKLSLLATMPRFKEMEAKHRSLIIAMIRGRLTKTDASGGATGPRYDLFSTLKPGLGTFVDRLAELIGPERIVTNTPAIELRRAGAEWRVVTAQKELCADAVISATPSWAAAQILSGVDETLANELRAIEYASSITLNLVYRREDITHPLDAFGFVVPACEGRALLACTFSSQKYAGRASGEKVLLRAFLGGALAPEMADLDDAEVLKRATHDLGEILGARQPIDSLITRWPRSMPQYHLGHLERVQRIDRQVEKNAGLQLCGNALRGIGIPDCVREGRRAAAATATFLGLN
jgi:oxygen-dependent protoporphyrinogen oxidase